MKYDPIRLELIKNAIGTVVDEMVITIVRVAYSSIMKDTMDISSAFIDSKGQMIAQGLSIPLHLGSFPDAIDAVLAEYDDDIHPGDIVILNDPFYGGMHLPDIFVFQPVFIGDHLLGFAVTVAHHNDVGGRVPGSSAADSTEIYQEGIRIPVVKLYDRGQPNEAVFKMLRLNVRIPDMLIGDINAQIAACQIADRGMKELVEYYGLDQLEAYFGHLLDYSEREARRTISELKDGTYIFTDSLDDDGIDPDNPIPVRVTVEIKGDILHIDFEGTSLQVSGAINSTLSFAKSAVYFAVRAIMESDAPNNAGFFRPISVSAPSGCLVNPQPPAAFAARGVSGFRVIDAMFGALAQAAPSLVRSAGEGGNTSYSVASYNTEGDLTLFREAVMGAWGAGDNREGVDGAANPACNISNAPIELAENQAPILVERYELVRDSGGPGLWRGGLGVEREIRFLGDKVTLQLRSDRRRFPPYGLAGGAAGIGSCNYIRENGTWNVAPAKFVRKLLKGDGLRLKTAGGGGYGDPLDRPAELVLEDVLNDKVSIEVALENYGVKIIAGPLRIDGKATSLERTQRKKTRKGDTQNEQRV